MKSMKFRLILLMMVIPLLLVFSTDTVVKATAVLVEIPVSKIEILGESSYSIDVAEEDNSITLTTVVTPSNATNKGVTFSASALEGETNTADVIITNNGDGTATIKPLTDGSVKITATADGGRNAAITVNYYSTQVLSATVIVDSFNKNEGDEFTITEGVDFSLAPGGTAGEINWTSSNSAVASVVEGYVTCHMTGRAIITATVEGLRVDAQTGEKQTFTHTLNFTVVIGATETSLGISFGGLTTDSKATTTNAVFNFSYDEEKLNSEYGGAFTLNYDSTQFEEVQLNLDTSSNSMQRFRASAYKTASITAKIRNSVPEGTVCTVSICDSVGNYITEVTVVKGVMTTASFVTTLTDNTVKVGWVSNYRIGTVQSDAADNSSYYVRFISSNTQVLTVRASRQDSTGLYSCYVTVLAEGSANISVQIYQTYDNTLLDSIVIAPLTVTAVQPYSTLAFAQSANIYGLENRLTVAKYTLNAEGEKVEITDFSLPLAGQIGNVRSAIAATDNKVIWHSSAPEIATIQGGLIEFGQVDGEVTFTAESAFNAVLGENVYAAFTLRCLNNAVNVSNYEQLTRAMEKKYSVCLTQDIYLAPLLESNDNFPLGNYDEYLEKCYSTMTPTADITYYINQNDADIKINYALEITADIYGNGHEINAHHLTVSLFENFGKRIFAGPLDLLRLFYSNTAPQNAAVKSQDNIVFLVQEDDIKLTNVELKGCDDEYLIEMGENNVPNVDLTNLDYCGTVLEVVGDNCSLRYSRVNNGRTVVRIYGAPDADIAAVNANPSAYRVSAYIGNCILTNGREFILKIGTNQAEKTPTQGTSVGKIDGSTMMPNGSNAFLYNEASPFLKKGGENIGFADLNDSDYAKNAEFYNKYVLTDITLENSVFRSAGLFCVGLESNFGGLCLYNYDYSAAHPFCSERGWRNIAGTSYPAVLRLVGDIRFYDWKKLSDVNSDTLITGTDTLLDTIGFNLDVGELIASCAGKFNYENLIRTMEGSQYVNGAIAYYGGGKNYSRVDLSGVSGDFNELSSFNVPLSVLGTRVNLVYYSAGREDFRFLLYDNLCALTPERQAADIADNTAYSWVERGE